MRIIDFIKKNVILTSIVGGITIACGLLFAKTLVAQNNLNKRFVNPTASAITSPNGLLGKSDQQYIVSTYANDQYTADLLKQLNKLEKEKGIPYYLIDIATYGQNFIDAYKITQSPTYYYIRYNETNKANEIVYRSYGSKSYELLTKELEYVELNGSSPLKEVETTKSDSDANISVTFDSIVTNTDDSSPITTAKFTVKNTDSKKVTFDSSWINACVYGTSTNAPKVYGDTTYEIEAGSSVTIEMQFEKIKATKVLITINLNDINGGTITFANNYLTQ